MDLRLFEAAQTGNIYNLHQLLKENPLILDTITLFSTETPLHIACIYGHVDFVKEILRLKPEFTKEINQDGFSPMHMAAANGHVEIVRELVKVDNKICRLEGRQKKTPLHYAAIKGRVDVITEMLLACGECIEDVTVQREIALHLAVKNCQFEAIRILVDWIRQLKKEDILNVRDEQGNTVLHLATWKKQSQVIELLLGNRTNSSSLLEVNVINHSGLTALDVLLMFPSEAGDREIEEILIGAGAIRARDITLSPISSFESHNQTLINRTMTPCQSQANDLLEYFKFKKGRDSPSEARSALLVIAVLVATATYQVGFSPPGGVWQDSNIPNQNNSTSSNKAHIAGESILGSSSTAVFCVYIIFNAIGFSMSLFMINILTSKFPLHFELQICIVAMYFTYGTAVVTIAPNGLKVFLIVFTSIIPPIIPFVAKWVREYMNRLKTLVVDMIHRII